MTNICRECDWYYVFFDEKERIDYCMKRDLYGDQLEKIIECPYFQDKYNKLKESFE